MDIRLNKAMIKRFNVSVDKLQRKVILCSDMALKYIIEQTKIIVINWEEMKKI